MGRCVSNDATCVGIALQRSLGIALSWCTADFRRLLEAYHGMGPALPFVGMVSLRTQPIGISWHGKFEAFHAGA